MSLVGRRILVTRSRHQASELASRLEALGATTILIPAIEIVPPLSFAPLDGAIAHLDRFDWIVFTSANAVEAFKQRSAVHVSPFLSHILTAAIGPATARAAAEAGLKVALVPPTAVAESLATALLSTISANMSVLLVRAESARDHLPNALTTAGVKLTTVEAYRTVAPQTSIASLKTLLACPANCPDAVTFTSSSTVNNLLDLLETVDLALPSSITCASIGPITSQTLRERAVRVHVEAGEATIASLVDTIELYFESTETSSAQLPKKFLL